MALVKRVSTDKATSVASSVEGQFYVLTAAAADSQHIENFDPHLEVWTPFLTTGALLPRLQVGASAAAGRFLYVYGCGRDELRSLYQLDVQTCVWVLLSTADAGRTMEDDNCKMVTHGESLVLLGSSSSIVTFDINNGIAAIVRLMHATELWLAS